jgi:hypothetical protein
MKLFLLQILILGLCAPLSQAQDRVFARTYQSNVLAEGSFDIEYWTTLRTGKVEKHSPYAFGRHLDTRFELEFGLGKNVQTAFYFNTSNFKFALLDSNATEFPTQTEIETSFSNEWKFKLSDPVANAFGSALYLELTVGSDEYEIEGKFILDKQINKDLFAFNLTGEYELETEVEFVGNKAKTVTKWEAPVELNFGWMHFLKPTFGLGLEIRNHNEIVKSEGWEHSALFAGPSLYFNQGKLWGVLNFLPQIINLHKTDSAPGNKVLDEHEEFETRLLIGYSF